MRKIQVNKMKYKADKVLTQDVPIPRREDKINHLYLNCCSQGKNLILKTIYSPPLGKSNNVYLGHNFIVT